MDFHLFETIYYEMHGISHKTIINFKFKKAKRSEKCHLKFWLTCS